MNYSNGFTGLDFGLSGMGSNPMAGLSGLNLGGTNPGLPAAAVRAHASKPSITGGAGTVDPNIDPTGGGFWGKIGGFEGLANMAEGLASLGSVFAAMKGVKLAEKQFDFTKEAYQTNLANQTQSYNTALEDRIRARYHQEGKTSAAADQYISANKL